MANSTKIGSLVVDVDGDIDKLRAEMRSAVGVVTNMTQEVQARTAALKNGFDTVLNPIRGMTSMLGPLAAGFGAILSINAFGKLVNDAAEAAGKMYDLSMQTGIAVEQLSALESVGKLSDVSLDTIANSANKMSKNLSSATEEGKGIASALRALNIDFDTFRKLSPDQQMLTVAKAMDNFADGGGKSAAAMAIMGKEGAAMIPFLKDLAAAGELNAKITSEQAAMADNYGDNLVKIQAASEAWKKQLAMSMLPVMEEVTGAWLEATNSNDGLGGSIKRLAADGTFTTWARNAVTAVTYLIDVGHGLLSLLPLIGTGIAGMAAAGSAAFGAIYDAYLKIKEGDLSGAWDSLKSGATQVGTIAKETGKDISEIWNQELLGEKIRKGMDKVRDARKEIAAEEKKEQLSFKAFAGKDEDSKAVREKTSAYENLTKSISEKIAVQTQELETGQALTDAEKLASKVMVEVRDGVLKLTDAEKKHVGALLEQLLAEEKSNSTRKEMIKLGADLVKSGNEQLKSLDAQIEAAARQNEEVGLTKEQVDQLAISRMEMAASADEELAANLRVGANYAGDLKDAYLEYASSLDEAAKKKRELANIKENTAERQADFEREKKEQAERIGFWESIDRTAHDTFISMWDNGKDAAQRLKDTFKNVFFDWLYQMTVKKWIVNVSAGFSGNASASGSGGSMDSSSMLSAGKSLWDGFSSSGSIGGGIANVAGNYIGQFGSLIGSQAVSAFASGLSGTAVGTMAGSGATIAGSATGLGSMSAAAGAGQGFGVLAAGAEAGSAAGAAGMGAGISSALAAIPVWGWAALAAAAIAAKFGGGKDRVIGDQSISGTLGTNDINRNVNWTKDGGWFHSDTSGTWNYNLANSTAIASNGQAYQDSASVANDQALLKRLNDTYASIKESSASFATALGLNAESIAKRSDTINFALGKTQEEIEKAIQSTFGSIADKIALDLMPGVTQLSKEGETAANTLARLATNFQTVNQGFDALGLKMFEMGEEGIKASEKFTAAVGGLQSFQAAQASFYQNFYSEEERNAELKKQLTAELQKQNLALPESRKGYRALLEEVSKTGTPEQLASLFKLNAAFASVFGEVDAAADLAATQLDQQVLSQQRLSAAAISATQAIEQQVLATAALERATAQKAYDDALQGRLRSGNVGEIMASNYALNPVDMLSYVGGGQFDAAGFNSEIIRQRAKLAIDLANQASADAINVEDITGVLASLFEFTKDREFENELRKSLPANARNQVSETVGYVFSDFIDASIAGIRLNQWTSRGKGITSVIAAQEDLQFQRDLQTGYSRSLSSANAMLHLGIITQEQYQAALSDANEILADNVRSQESLNDALRQAGIDSVSFYFDQIGKSVEALNAAAIEAQEPLAQVNASIGRLKSIGDVLSLSANAAGGDAKADLVAKSAALAASALTTQSAAQIAKELAAKESFAGIDDPQLRNLSMLIEGVKSFDAGSFEAGFLRISDALNKGMINESQYQDLFDQSLSTFKGADQEVEALSNSMAKLRDSMSSFADGLMVDKQRTALSSIESFAALQSQYDTAKMLAATGDSAAVSRFQSLATQLLDRDDYKTRGDYNAQFSRVLGDARYLETIGASSVQNDGQNIVDELVKMNGDLTKELTKLREEMRVSMGAIANNTSKTASGVGTLVTQG